MPRWLLAATLIWQLFGGAVRAEYEVRSPDHGQCLEAMLFGPQRKDVTVYGNGLNCNRVEVRRLRDGSVRVSGRIDHRVTLDSDYYWHFIFFIEPDGAIKRIDAGFYNAFRAEDRKADDGLIYVMKGFGDSREAELWLRGEKRPPAEEVFLLAFIMPPPGDFSTVYLFRDFAALLAESRFNAAMNKRDGGVEWFIARRGRAISTSTIDGGPRECAARCADNARCRAWTYQHIDRDRPKPLCRLMSTAEKGAFEFSEESASGLKYLGAKPLTDPAAGGIAEEVGEAELQR